jgi:uncharacterized protein (DUF2147 family)
MKIYLDDERQTPEGWTRCFWPNEVIELLKNNKVTHVSLDHDLGDDKRGTGYDVLTWVEEQVHTRNYYPPLLSVHSANPALRNRKILGMEILDGLRYDAQKKEWVNGKIYDASSGRYWSSCAKLLQNGILKVRGFWKVEWIGKSISFRKVS